MIIWALITVTWVALVAAFVLVGATRRSVSTDKHRIARMQRDQLDSFTGLLVGVEAAADPAAAARRARRLLDAVRDEITP